MQKKNLITNVDRQSFLPAKESVNF